MARSALQSCVAGFGGSLSLRLKDLLGPVTRVKKKEIRAGFGEDARRNNILPPRNSYTSILGDI